jgi:PAS domain S-box-containing protein
VETNSSKQNIERYIAVGFIVIWVLVLWAAVLTYRNSQKIIQAGKNLAASNYVLYQAESLKREITDIESYTRAYIITADSNFSAIAATTMDSAYMRAGQLRFLLKSDLVQLARLDSAVKLGEINTLRNKYLRTLIKEGKEKEAIKYVQSGIIVSTTRQIQAVLSEIMTQEKVNYARQESGFRDEQQFFFTVFVVRLILIPLILITLYFVIVNNLRSVRKTESRLNETTELLSGLIEYAPITIALSDTKGRIVVANDAMVKPFGLTAEQVIGKTAADFLPASVFEKARQEDIGIILTNLRNESENTVVINGVEQSFLTIRFPLHDDSGKINYIGTVGLNITELKSKKEVIVQLNNDLENRVKELEEINEELQNFTSSVAHDLRTPLRAISSFSNILQIEHAANLQPEAKRLLGILDDNARNMGKLIDDLLNYAGIGRAKLLLADANLTEIAFSTVEKLKHAYPSLEVNVSFSKSETVKCDTILIQQVLQNLFDNAFKYSAYTHTPSIQFNSLERNGFLVFCIKDNGVGFDSKFSGKLFSMFQRLHSDEQFEGNGMGLAIVQRIIQKHGGKVWAESKVNEGAAFYFSLPYKNQTNHELN